MSGRRHASLLAVVALLALVASRARADEDVRGQVLVVLAQHAEGVVDPRVAEQPALHQPPFDAFHSMSVLSANDVVVGVGHAATVTLPNGRTLRLELEASTGTRLRVRAQITQANGRDYLPGVTVETDPGLPFVVAGQTHAGGTLVLLVTLGARPPPTARIPLGTAPALRPGLQRELVPPRALLPTTPAPAPPATQTPPVQQPTQTSPARAPSGPSGATAARKNAPPPSPPPPPAES